MESATIDGFVGVICMVVNVAVVTINVVVELILLAGSVAVIVTVPGSIPSATPLLALSLLMVATAVSLELHVTDDVRSWVLASE